MYAICRAQCRFTYEKTSVTVTLLKQRAFLSTTLTPDKAFRGTRINLGKQHTVPNLLSVTSDRDLSIIATFEHD